MAESVTTMLGSKVQKVEREQKLQQVPKVQRMQKGQKSIIDIASEVIAGKWGNGNERKERLKKAGYDAEAVQKKVNELLR